MQTANTSFINTLRWGTYLVAARLTVQIGGQPTQIILPVSDARFTVDRNSEFRRQGQITLEVQATNPPQTVTALGTSYTYLPLDPTCLLAPFGNEVFVEMTVMADPSKGIGSNGWIPLGLFQIATTTVQEAGIDLTVTLNLYDRSWAIAQRALTAAYTMPASDGTLLGETSALLSTVWGTTIPWNYNIASSPYAVPSGTYNQGEDPWQALTDIFTAAGFELFFDVYGNVTGTPIPTPSKQATVWNFYEGEVSAQGTFLHSLGGTPFTTPVDVSLTLTRSGVANAWYVTASGANNAGGSSTPTQVVAQDLNPLSPTYINGPMGQVPSFVYDGNITTTAQAQAEANYDLTVALAKAWTVSVSTPPNPLFDIDDVCTVTRARLGLNQRRFIVDTIQTSIRYDVQTVLSGRMI